MKKSMILAAGFLAMAVAGSAQAAPQTMFAVQNSSAVDQFTVNDAGQINKLDVIGAAAIGLANVPGTPALTQGVGALHVGTKGSDYTFASGTYQHVSFPTTVGGPTYDPTNASNFSFYRINQNDSTLAYGLPSPGAALGYLNFGVIDVLQNPSTTAYRKNLAQFWVKAEPATTANPNAWTAITNTPAFIQFMTTSWNGSAMTPLTEKMRITSDGKVGIGTNSVNLPTSKLHVIGLPVCPDNVTAKTATPTGCGLTAGAFYLQGPVGGPTTAGALMVAF